jgi:hypothetical protein
VDPGGTTTAGVLVSFNGPLGVDAIYTDPATGNPIGSDGALASLSVTSTDALLVRGANVAGNATLTTLANPLNPTAGITFFDSVNAGSLVAEATGDIQINTGVTLGAGGTGNSLVLAASGNFVNNGGAGALLAPAGRWLVYSTSPGGSTEGGLTGAAGSALPRLYNRTYVANGPASISEPGNHLIYSAQPTLNVNADAASRAYGDANPAFTFATSGFVTDDSVTDTLAQTGLTGALATSAVANSPVGPYAITVGTLVSGAGYGFNYTGADLTVGARGITAIADNQTKVYGNADPALSFTIGGGGLASGDSLGTVFSGAITRAAGETVNGGPYDITQGTLAANANYNLTSFTNGELTITQRPIALTADPGQGKIYGNTDPVLTYAVTTGNLVGLDTLSGAASRAAGENVGSYAIGQGTLAKSNYSITFTTDDFAIAQRPITVTADPGQGKIYGNADPVLTYAVTTGNLVGLDTLSGAASRAAGENVGGYTIGQGTLANANYSIIFSTDNFAIAQRPLSVAADDKTRVARVANPPFTATFTGFAPGEGLGDLSGALAFTTPAVTASPMGNYAITPLGLTSTNYAITYVDGVLRITTAASDLPQNSQVINGLERISRLLDNEGAQESGAAAGCRRLGGNLFDCR